MDEYRICTVKEAIEILKDLRDKGRSTVVVFTTDLDNKSTEDKRVITIEDGCQLAHDSKTIMLGTGNVFHLMQLYSTPQPNIEAIVLNGKMHNILLPKLE